MFLMCACVYFQMLGTEKLKPHVRNPPLNRMRLGLEINTYMYIYTQTHIYL